MRAALLFLLALPLAAAPPTGNVNGWCQDGAKKVTTSGITSTTNVQGSYPSCTVTVYYTGTTTTATIYSNATGTGLGNPFTAQSSGQWSFWAAAGVYDVKFSGGGIASPFTIAGYTVAPTSAAAFGVVCDGSTNTTTALQNALNSGAGTLRLGPGTCTVTGLTMASNNQALFCDDGAIIQARASTSQVITMTGANQTVQGCTFDGNSNGSNGNILVYANGASYLTFQGNTLKGTVPGQYAFRGISLTDSLLQGNACTGVGAGCISTDDGSARVKIVGNTGDSSSMTNGAISGSLFQAKSSANTSITDITFTANQCKLGGGGFCIEAGNFGGSGAVTGVTLVGNTALNTNANGSSCTATSSPESCGGYSFSTLSNSTMTGNTYDANGHTTDIAGAEMTRCTSCTFVGNVLKGGATGIAGLSLNCLKCIVSNNQLIGWTTNNGAIYDSPTADFLDNGSNVITGNFVTATLSGDTAININCNRASGSITRDVITGNVLVGLGSTVGTGLTVAQNNGTCTLDSNIVGGNTFTNLSKGVLFNTSTNTGWTDNTFTSVTTHFQDNGSASTYIANHFPNAVNIGSQSDPTHVLDVAGTMQATGNSFFTNGLFVTSGGWVYGASSNPGADALHVSGGAVLSTTGTLCLTPAVDCSTVASTNSPILRIRAGDGVSTNRLDIQANGVTDVSLNSVDANPITLKSGSLVYSKFLNIGVQPISRTLAQVGNCGTGVKTTPTFAIISDSTTTTWGADITGGSTNKVLAYCDGTSTHWTVFAKAGS